jgi:hypothetical protein
LGVTAASNGESYCKDSHGYPELKKDLLGNFSAEEGTISGITQKVLSIAGYRDAKIYTGCDERATTISVLIKPTNLASPFLAQKERDLGCSFLCQGNQD